MKRHHLAALLVALLFVTALPLSAQLVADPNDRLYLDLSLWQDRGLLTNLPQLRPYPIQLVKTLLEVVSAKGDEADRERAQRYLSELQDVIRAHAVASTEARTDLKSVFFQPGAASQYQGVVSPFITYSGTLGVLAPNGPQNSLLPIYARPVEDIIYDGGTPPLGSTGLTARIFITSDTGFGDDSIYGQAGIVRSSFGPFWDDNAVLSPFAPQAGRVSFTFRRELFTYTQTLLDMSATQNDGGGLPAPGKFLSLHSLEVNPWPWLSVSAFDTIVWGGRFEPLYLLPFPTVYYVGQGLVGFPDNSLIGLSASVSLPASLRADMLLYIDDAALFDLLKLDFNTKLLLSFQAGLTWTPDLPVLSRISLNGIIVTPYTYTHSDNNGDAPGAINYLNYTNNGQSMGPSLLPNSVRVKLGALLRPVDALDIDAFAQLILHGNASEGVPGGGDGSLFDPGVIGGQQTYNPPYPLPSGLGYFRFLTQSDIQKILQTGFDAKAYIPTTIGEMRVEASYTLEYTFGAVNNYLGIRFSYLY